MHCQILPTKGQYDFGINLALEDLMVAPISPNEIVYCYVVGTIQCTNGCFEQIGSGPNFEGGLFTLCTCKHYMRTFFAPQDWKNKWIAGFSSKYSGKFSANSLVYLMKVRSAFSSFRDLWFSESISEVVKFTKSARNNAFGDIYEPKNFDVEPFRHESYIPPCEGHSHYKDDQWLTDIDYNEGVAKRKPALLVGDTKNSFLWNFPSIFLDRHPLHRGQTRTSLSELFSDLKEYPK
jgi:hypothetical protein